jgi:hypothetical protein
MKTLNRIYMTANVRNNPDIDLVRMTKNSWKELTAEPAHLRSQISCLNLINIVSNFQRMRLTFSPDPRFATDCLVAKRFDDRALNQSF